MKIRPTFSIEVADSGPDPIMAVRQAVATEPTIEGQFRAGHAMLAIRPDQRHFWSPWLHLDIRKSEDRNVLFGRFSPHPTIWTAYVFAYGTLAILSSFSLVFGASQYLAKAWPSAILAFPICIVVAVALWITAQIGQRMAHEEMHRMRDLVQNAVQSEPRQADSVPRETRGAVS